MATTESLQHQNLKRLALAWAQERGYRACAVECRLPNSAYVADVLAYRREKVGVPGTTALFECKQSRTDFLKDSYASAPTAERLMRLDERRSTLERLLRIHHPSLRTGDSLFQEYQSFDFAKLEHRTYRKVLREITELQSRLYTKTKFDKIGRWHCANLLHLVVEDGILASHEVPVGWGLLVRRGDRLEMERKPLWQDTTDSARIELLHRIAMGGTRRLNRELGIETGDPPRYLRG